MSETSAGQANFVRGWMDKKKKTEAPTSDVRTKNFVLTFS